MDIGKALSYITEDPRWKEKIAIGTGVVILSTILSVVLIGLVGFFIVTGYTVRLLQNVRDGATHPLPEWDQWGEDLVRGLKLVVVAVVWALPAILFSVPVALGGALADGRGAGAFVGSTILFGGMCLVVLYSIFLTVAQASFTIAFARDEQISSGLQVREIWDWTLANIGQLVIVALAYIVVGIGVSLVASIVGTLLCIIGLIVTLPLGQLVVYLFQYHLYGQLAAAYPFGGASGSPAGPNSDPGAGPGMAAGPSRDNPDGSSTVSESMGDTVSGVGAAATGAGAAAAGPTFEDNPYAAYGPGEDITEGALATPSAEETPPAREDEAATLAATATPESATPEDETAPPADAEGILEEEIYPHSGVAGRDPEEGAGEDTEEETEEDTDADKNKPANS